MDRKTKDKSGKWLLEHFGEQLLRVGGVEDVLVCRPAQAQLVLPEQTPDGLLDVWRRGRPDPEPVLVELATYPEQRVVEQVIRGMMLTYLDRGTLPDAIVYVFQPKGQYQVPESQ